VGQLIRVELVDAEQAELVLRLAVEAFEEFRHVLVPPPGILAETAADVARYIEAGGAVLAWDGEVAVGSARFHPKPDHFYIGRVAVPPAYRRRGVATVIMRFLEEHARSLGFTETRVEVRQALPSNIALYESLGYQPTGIQPHPRVPTAQIVKLTKILDKPLLPTMPDNPGDESQG
jgi:ribosomal protein S18 acetylase RimI-like enzyme